MMTTNSCAAHAMHRESQMPHEDIRPSRAAGDAVLEFGRFRLLLRRRQLIADGVPIELGSRVLAGSGKNPEFSKGCRSVGVPWMPGTRPGMTISLELSSLRHGRACPGHPRADWNSRDCSAQRFFRTLLDRLLALIEADGSLVTKSELLRRVWPGMVVAEDNLKVQIATLRKALGKDRDFISTEFGRGYRFTADVRAVAWNTCQWPTFGGSQPSRRLRARWISRRPHARRALRPLPARIDAAGSK